MFICTCGKIFCESCKARLEENGEEKYEENHEEKHEEIDDSKNNHELINYSE